MHVPCRPICRGSRAGAMWQGGVRQHAQRALRAFATAGHVAPPTAPAVPFVAADAVPVADEVATLVDRLCRLDLVQTAQVVTLLKRRLNLPDVVAAPAAAAPPAAAAAEAADAAPPVAEKTEFRITLDKFDPTSKAKVIREIKVLLPQMNLVEAKAFVEGAPKVVREKAKREEAEKIKKTLEDLGATVTLD